MHSLILKLLDVKFQHLLPALIVQIFKVNLLKLLDIKFQHLLPALIVQIFKVNLFQCSVVVYEFQEKLFCEEW